MRRLRAILRLRRMRQAKAQRVIEIAGRTGIERRGMELNRRVRRHRQRTDGGFSGDWLMRARAAR